MAAVLPPAELDPEHLGAWAEPHVGEARHGEFHVIAEGMGADALLGECGEGCVELGREGGGAVVGGDEGAGLSVLLRGIEGARGQVFDVDHVGVGVPVDIPGAGEIDADGFGPAVEAGIGALAGIDGVAGRERLKDVEGAFIAEGPRDEGQQSEEGAEHGPAQHGDGAPAFVSIEDDGGAEGEAEESAVGAEEGGVAPRGGHGERPGPARRLKKAIECIEGEGGGEEFQCFGERNGGEVGGEGAEGGEPEGAPAGAVIHDAAGAPDATRERGDEEAGGEVDGDLRVHHSVVVLDAEEAEAEDEEEGIAGKTDECWVNVGAAGHSVDAVEHPVLRDVSVDEGVAIDFGVGVDEPEAEDGSGGEGEREEEPFF